MMTNNNVSSSLQILDWQQTFEILGESENLQLTKKETLNNKVGFSSNSCCGSNILIPYNSVSINDIAESDHSIGNTNSLSSDNNFSNNMEVIQLIIA
jgi:hypothetical protein